MSRYSQARRRVRLDALDALRGLAALAVVIYHFGFRVAEIYPDVGVPIASLAAGQYGVHLFFLISGFVIFLTLQRATPSSFVISRIIRLYPIYWVCAAVTFTAVALAGLPGREVSWFEAGVNTTMLQGFLGVPHIDGAYWTLTAELGFYIQIGLLFFTSRLLKGRRLVVALYVWLSLATVASQLPKVLPEGAIRDAASNLSLGVVWIPIFIAGIALYVIWTGERSLMLIGLPVFAVAAIAVRDVTLGIALTGCIGLVIIAVSAPIAGRAMKPLIFLGEVSYALYLVHQNIGFILIRWLTQFGLSHVLAASAALVVVLALATVLTFFVDKPLRRMLTRKFCPTTSVPTTDRATTI